MDNIIIKILENQENARKQNVKSWGTYNRNKLVNVLEKSGEIISNNLFDMLLFNINTLEIKNGKICYTSYYPPSKKIISLLSKHNDIIIENFEHITKH